MSLLTTLRYRPPGVLAPAVVQEEGVKRIPVSLANLQFMSGRPEVHYHNTVVNRVEHAENINSGPNYGTFHQSSSLALDHHKFDSLPRHPDVIGRQSEYLENSRTDELEIIQTWLRSSTDLVLCIHAAAGIGKSTLAYRLGEEQRSTGRLAAAIFMDVLPPEWGLETVVRLIAGEIGRIHPKAIPSIAEAIEQFSGSSVTPQQLFDNFIRRPIQSLRLPYSLNVIMDAVDEWKMRDTFIAQLASLERSRKLVKFVILGRVKLKAYNSPKISIFHYLLPPVSKGVLIRFFQERFSKIHWSLAHKRSERLINDQIDGLAEKAQGVFAWAHTACNILGSEYRSVPREQLLEEMLQSARTVGDPGPLAELYHGAIMRAFPQDDQRKHLRRYLQAIFVLQEPLPIADFSRLLSMEEETVSRIREGLSALQTREPPNADTMIYPAPSLFHLSVTDYLQSSSLPEDLAFRISLSDGHAMLAAACLTILPSLVTRSQETELSLQAMRKYVMEHWPIHMTQGTTPVDPGSVMGWEEAPLLVFFDEIPLNSLLGWADSLLQSLDVGGAHSLNRPPDSDVTDLMFSVGMAIPHYTYDTKALNLKIACLEITLRLCPSTAKYWCCLGWAYSRLAEEVFAPEACERAIAIYRHGVRLATTDAEGDEVAVKVGLAEAIQMAYRRYQGVVAADIEESISLFVEVLHLRPEGHPDRSGSLNDLACSLRKRFEITKVLDDLEEAIKLDRGALELQPEGHPDRPRSLNNLACSFRRRFEIIEDPDDLEEATNMDRSALELRPEGHPDRCQSLNNLAASLRNRFKVTKSLDNLEEAINLNRSALELRLEGHPDRSMSLNNLAISLFNRFKLTKVLGDLDEAIDLGRSALILRPKGHPDRRQSLSNLASSLTNRFEVADALEDLEEAIKLNREALSLRPEGHPRRPTSLFNLAHSLHKLFKITHVPELLDESINLSREELVLCPGGHPYVHCSLGNLGLWLYCRFQHQGNIEDLREAISLNDEALARCPNGDCKDREQLLKDASTFREELDAWQRWHAGEEQGGGS